MSGARWNHPANQMSALQWATVNILAGMCAGNKLLLNCTRDDIGPAEEHALKVQAVANLASELAMAALEAPSE